MTYEKKKKEKKKVFKCPDQSSSQNWKLFRVMPFQACHAIWVSMSHSHKKKKKLPNVTLSYS